MESEIAYFIEFFLIILSWLLLINISAFASSSEVALFKLDSSDLEFIQKKHPKDFSKISKLLQTPDKLLSTILILNNIVNIAIVLVSSFILSKYLKIHNLSPTLKFILEIILITLIILIFGEIIPKIIASKYTISIARLNSPILLSLQKILFPLVFIFQKSVYFINTINYKQHVSLDDLSYAIELTKINSKEEKQILRNIIKFGDTEVRHIMKPRTDVVCVDYSMNYKNILEIIKENQYSRLPVTKDSLDNIEGILYIKDLLTINESEDWHRLIKEPYFVPENMKIDILLEEFKKKKIHMAIVSDEYGAFIGIVTLEDVIEEIFGEINDEFDEPNEAIKNIGQNKYSTIGTLLLQDFINYFNLSQDYFHEHEKIETLAGLILEIKNDFPKNNETIIYKDFKFTIKKMSKTKIEEIIIEKNG